MLVFIVLNFRRSLVARKTEKSDDRTCQEGRNQLHLFRKSPIFCFWYEILLVSFRNYISNLKILSL